MNDFTKEELEQIACCVYAVCSSSMISEMNHGELYEKIQRMIDNYCEHIWSDGGGNYICCIKCHVIGGKR